MRNWTASVLAALLFGFPGVAGAQANCAAMPRGPARTDCYLGADRARAQSDAAWYRAITGTDPPKYRARRRR